MTRRLLTLLAILLIATLVIAACGGGEEEPTPEPAPAVAEQATEAPAPAEQPTEAPVEEKAEPAMSVACEGEGSVLLWHAWSGAEAETLDKILAMWAEACPSITVETLNVSFDELKSKFSTSAASGEGPDFMIGPVDWIGELAEAGLLKDITPLVSQADLAAYTPSAVGGLRYQGGLYAIPESVEAVAMYYNKSLIETPPTTLDELLEAAANNGGLALNRGFYHAFWGIPANGGRLFDENGVAVLDQGGFGDWLDWLAAHQNDPGMNLSSDYGKLNSLFKEGQAALYPDGPWALGDLAAALGAENVGVAPLPAGPGGASGPFLGIKNVMFSSIPDDAQTQLALQFTKFLTGVDAQTLLMEEAGHISANVNVEPSSEQVAGFVAQAKTAYPFPNIPEMGAVWTPGDDAYTKVLEGQMSGADAAAEAAQAINSANGKTGAAAQPPFTCTGEGSVLLWHAWSGAEAETLDEILASFAEACPSITVETLNVSFDELKNKFSTSAASGEGPDFMIGPVDWIGELAEAGLLKDITPLVDAQALQRYTPSAVDALRYQGGLYAIPESVEAVAMYYNKSLIETPPTTLDELLEAAANNGGLALNRGFYHAFWGIPANGGRLFDNDGVCVLDQAGFGDWLDWLAAHQNDPGMNLSSDYGKLNSLFKEGQAALYPDGPWALGDLAATLGAENVGVAPLPAGPGGASGPFLGVKNVMFSSIPDDAQTQLALEFARYLTGVDAQTLLMEKAGHISANVNVQPSNEQVGGFVAQTKTAYPFPNIPEMGAVWTPGDDAYTKVLEGQMSGADAAAEACTTINAANGK